MFPLANLRDAKFLNNDPLDTLMCSMPFRVNVSSSVGQAVFSSCACNEENYPIYVQIIERQYTNALRPGAEIYILTGVFTD